MPHRFVYGGFRGTDARFAFYFPAPEQYDGRFIQGPVHQLRLTGEVASKEEIEFAFDSGAYLIETNNGGNESCLTARDCLSGRYDPAIRGYRVNAAAAKFSRSLAAEIYGDHRRCLLVSKREHALSSGSRLLREGGPRLTNPGRVVRG